MDDENIIYLVIAETSEFQWRGGMYGHYGWEHISTEIKGAFTTLAMAEVRLKDAPPRPERKHDQEGDESEWWRIEEIPLDCTSELVL